MKKCFLSRVGFILCAFVLMQGLCGCKKEVTSVSETVSKDKTEIVEISLSGIEEIEFTTTEYSYLESDKYFLLIDKDITLPGNFKIVTDAIIDEVEKETGLYYDTDRWTKCGSIVATAYVGFEPWEGLDFGKKIPIYIFNDREPAGYISWASDEATVFVIYELMSDELWNSIPEYRDNPWRKRDYMDYGTIAHELTHTIVGRNVSLSRIMTEGIATRMQRVVPENLSKRFDSVVYEEDGYDGIPDAITKDNAEAIFLSDYAEIDHAHRGAEYTLGMIICDYMYETFGNDAFKRYVDEINNRNISFLYGNQTEEDLVKLTEAMKAVFGEDFFVNFGDWYGKNVDRYPMYFAVVE